MEQGLYPYLLQWLQPLWWPFVRTMALLSFAPIFGDPTVPQRDRLAQDGRSYRLKAVYRF